MERCFDLARDVKVHCRTAAFTGERAVAGVTTGLLELGETVTFEGVHFGVRQRLTARVVELDRPRRFVDEMVSGAFQALRHEHVFRPDGSATVMEDILVWTCPFGLLGRLADPIVARHLRGFVVRRNAALKRMAEEAAP